MALTAANYLTEGKGNLWIPTLVPLKPLIKEGELILWYILQSAANILESKNKAFM